MNDVITMGDLIKVVIFLGISIICLAIIVRSEVVALQRRIDELLKKIK